MCYRGGVKVERKAVEQSYVSVFITLVLHFGSWHGLANSVQLEPLCALLVAFHSFCDYVDDLDMGKILSRDGEQNDNEKCINLIGDLAGCISIKRPKEVPRICLILCKSLELSQRFQRDHKDFKGKQLLRHCRRLYGTDG